MRAVNYFDPIHFEKILIMNCRKDVDRIMWRWNFGINLIKVYVCVLLFHIIEEVENKELSELAPALHIGKDARL